MAILKRLNDNSLFLLSLILTLVACSFSYGFYHPDEQYYAINFAAFKAGLLPQPQSWEYQTMLRPWLLPAIFTPVLNITKLLNLSPFGMAFLLRVLSGLVAWFSVVCFNRALKNHFPGSISYNIFIFFTHFSFFCFFMQVRTSSENWSTSLILLSISLFIKKVPYPRDFVFGGLLFGLAFSLRHQTGLIALGFGLWLLMIKQVGLKNWFAYFVPSILIGVLIGFIADFWGYGQLTFTPWNYLYQNLFLNKAAQFGVSPFYSYILWSLKDLTPLWGLIIFIGLIRLFFVDKGHWVLWTTLPFIFIHFLIGHKELRFLYPVAPMLLFAGAQLFPERSLRREPLRKYFYLATVFINLILLLFVIFKPAYTPLGLYKYVYQKDINEVLVLKDLHGNHPTLEMPFYKKQNLTIQAVDSISNGVYFTTKFSDISRFPESSCTTLYSSYPKWLFDYNYFSWLNRSSIWMLTKCQ